MLLYGYEKAHLFIFSYIFSDGLLLTVERRNLLCGIQRFRSLNNTILCLRAKIN